VASLVQPTLFLIALGFGLGPIYQKAGEGNYINFLAAGVVCMSVLFASVFTGIDLIWDKQFGFLKETLVAPVSRVGIMLGRTLGGATIAMFQGSIVLMIAISMGFRPSSYSGVMLALVFMFMIAILFTALGTTIASVINDMQGFQMIMNFLVMPVFFLSGALFPLDDIPAVLQIITTINPLTYGIDGVRGALTGISFFGPIVDLIALSGVAVILVIVGSYLFTRIEV
jgi:ABC-2 type transport system permease protein